MERTDNEPDLRAEGPGGAIMKKALRLRLRILSAFISLSAVHRGISKVVDDPGAQSRGCLAAPSWGERVYRWRRLRALGSQGRARVVASAREGSLVATARMSVYALLPQTREPATQCFVVMRAAR